LDKNRLEKWKTRKTSTLFKNNFASIDEVENRCSNKTGIFYQINLPNWTNIITLTKDKKIVIIKQFRHGKMEFTWEIPGGVIDDQEEPLIGAKRELREETGYLSNNWTFIGEVYPNPAIQTNSCFIFLAKDAYCGAPVDFDEDEDIITSLVSIEELKEIINKGEFKNAIVLAGILLALEHLEL
jgi:ADP-ribose diphosphatase